MNDDVVTPLEPPAIAGAQPIREDTSSSSQPSDHHSAMEDGEERPVVVTSDSLELEASGQEEGSSAEERGQDGDEPSHTDNSNA
jgi:hypothetical protein